MELCILSISLKILEKKRFSPLTSYMFSTNPNIQKSCLVLNLKEHSKHILQKIENKIKVLKRTLTNI